MGDRDYFAQARTTDQMVVSEPLVSHSFGKWSIVLARRLLSEDGESVILALAIACRRPPDWGKHLEVSCSS